MRKMTRWMLAAILTFCGAMMMLTACTDAIGTVDNPVIPDPPYDPAGELANETFLHEDWMDRTVRPGDSFWRSGILPSAVGSRRGMPTTLVPITDLRSTSMRNSKAIWATAIRPWPAN